MVSHGFAFFINFGGRAETHSMEKCLDNLLETGVGANDQSGATDECNQYILDDHENFGCSFCLLGKCAVIDQCGKRKTQHRQAQCTEQRDEQFQIGYRNGQHNCNARKIEEKLGTVFRVVHPTFLCELQLTDTYT